MKFVLLNTIKQSPIYRPLQVKCCLMKMVRKSRRCSIVLAASTCSEFQKIKVSLLNNLLTLKNSVILFDTKNSLWSYLSAIAVFQLHLSDYSTCLCSGCGLSWCSDCSLEPHWPMDCAQFAEWKAKWAQQCEFCNILVIHDENVYRSTGCECRGCGWIHQEVHLQMWSSQQCKFYFSLTPFSYILKLNFKILIY